jgi:hypothetical protein
MNMFEPDIWLPEPKPIQLKLVGPEIWMYTSPLPDEAVVSGTLKEYEIPFSLAVTDWAYAEEPIRSIIRLLTLRSTHKHTKACKTYPDPKGRLQLMLFSS